MRIKDCLSCKMDEERVVNFLAAVCCDAQEMESTKDAWANYWDQCDDDDADYPKDFMEHLRKDHEEELDVIGGKIWNMREAMVLEIHQAAANIVKEVL